MKLILPILLYLPLMFMAQLGIENVQSKKELEGLNREWMKYNLPPKNFEQVDFDDDMDLIPYHFDNVIHILQHASMHDLTERQWYNRSQNIQSLIDYRQRQLYPKNFHHRNRKPYFIDDEGTACAVAYLLQISGYITLANSIAANENYDLIKEIKHPGLVMWQKQSGLTLDELALIQPTYGPVSKPQPPIPVCGSNYTFNNDSFVKKKNKDTLFYSGGCEEGILNGKWEVWDIDSNFAVRGSFSNGKKHGTWLEKSVKGYPLSTRYRIYNNWRGDVSPPTRGHKPTPNPPFKPKPSNETLPRFTIEEHAAYFNYVNGLKNGLYISYNEKSQIVRKGRYANDCQDGTWYTYNSNGSVIERNYYRGDLHGRVVYRDFLGRIGTENNYYYGQEHGVQMYYVDGILVQKENYRYGQKHGSTVCYKNNRRIREEYYEYDTYTRLIIREPSAYRKLTELSYAYEPSLGMDVVKETQWFKTVNLVAFRGSYAGNLANYTHSRSIPRAVGKHTYYYLIEESSGKYKTVLSELKWFNKDGQQHGKNRAYREDGSIYKELVFKYGHPVSGYIELLDQPGILTEEYVAGYDSVTQLVAYCNGKKEHIWKFKITKNGRAKTGMWTYYDSNGKIQMEFDYLSNNQIGERHYYDNEQLRLSHHANQKYSISLFEEYFKNGQLKTKGSYAQKTSLKVGLWKYLNKNGQVIKEEYHDINSPRYRVVSYHSNGLKRKEFETDHEGNLFGSVEEWNEVGMLVLSENYDSNGNPVGKWVYYSEEHKPLLTIDHTVKNEIQVVEYYLSGPVQYVYSLVPSALTDSRSNYNLSLYAGIYGVKNIFKGEFMSYKFNGEIIYSAFYNDRGQLKWVNDIENKEHYSYHFNSNGNLMYILFKQYTDTKAYKEYTLDSNFCNTSYQEVGKEYGQLIEAGSYYLGMKVGKWLYYDIDLIKFEQHTIVDSVGLVSQVDVFNPKGVLLESYFLTSNGTRCSDYVKFHRNGKMKLKGRYSLQGEKIGEWNYYNRREKIIQTDLYEDNSTAKS